MRDYLHPAEYAAIANRMLADHAEGVILLKGARRRRFRKEVTLGIEAAIALALDVPGVYVHPEPAAA